MQSTSKNLRKFEYFVNIKLNITHYHYSSE